jgi:hypothetical protein
MRKDKKKYIVHLSSQQAWSLKLSTVLSGFLPINYYSVSIWFIFKWCQRALSRGVQQDISQTKRKRLYSGLPRMTQILCKNPSQGSTESFPERT